MNEKQKVRTASVAGMFYSASASTLRKNIDEMIENAQIPKINGKIFGLVSPHAGYVYSGLTAAHAYKTLTGKSYDCVIIIGPSHREYLDGVSIYPGKAYETPLGKIFINDEIRSELVKSRSSIVLSEAGHRSEHSIEVQLPFLQMVFGEFTFVPVVMGNQGRELCNELAETLADAARNRNLLIVASSDLSHYHSYREAEILDKRVINDVESYQPEKFLDNMEDNCFEACGGGPIAVVMKTAKMLGADKSRVVHYCNSGDVTGDKSAVVGYLSAVFYQE